MRPNPPHKSLEKWFSVFRMQFCRSGKIVTFGTHADSDAVFRIINQIWGRGFESIDTHFFRNQRGFFTFFWGQRLFWPGKNRKMEKCAVFEILVSFGKSAQGSLNPCGRGRKKTENFGRLCRQMARERREKRFFLENSGSRYSLHNPRFEGELAKNKKTDIERSMPELSKVLVEVMNKNQRHYFWG